MKKFIILLVLSINTQAETAKELHDESCVQCHIAKHDKVFYTNPNRKVDSFLSLSTQVSRCTSVLDVGWFPEERQSVVNFLNTEFYKFDKISK